MRRPTQVASTRTFWRQVGHRILFMVENSFRAPAACTLGFETRALSAFCRQILPSQDCSPCSLLPLETLEQSSRAFLGEIERESPLNFGPHGRWELLQKLIVNRSADCQ